MSEKSALLTHMRVSHFYFDTATQDSAVKPHLRLFEIGHQNVPRSLKIRCNLRSNTRLRWQRRCAVAGGVKVGHFCPFGLRECLEILSVFSTPMILR